VRDVMGGPALDAALALAAEARALRGDVNPAQALSRIESAADALRTPKPDGAPNWRPAEPDLRGIPSSAAGRSPTAGRAADWYLASVLSSIVYASFVGERDSQALLGGDPSRLHDLGPAEVDRGGSALVPWRVPAEVRDRKVGWHVQGSLLGLDLALGRFALRRVSKDEVPPAPRVNHAERLALTEPVLLQSPFDQSEAGRDGLLAALARGRARLADARASSEALLKAAAAVDLDEWRTQMLPWMLEHERERIAELWSLAELVRLGAADERGADSFDAFGSSMWSVRGQLACRFPWRQPWTTVAGRKGVRVVAGLMPDLAVAVAESLAAMKLPVRLYAGVLAVATQELLNTVRMDHDDDWLALVAGVQRVAGRPFEDYVAALTYDGPLIPILQEPGHATRH